LTDDGTVESLAMTLGGSI